MDTGPGRGAGHNLDFQGHFPEHALGAAFGGAPGALAPGDSVSDPPPTTPPHRPPGGRGGAPTKFKSIGRRTPKIGSVVKFRGRPGRARGPGRPRQSWCDYKVPQTLEGYWGFQVVGLTKGFFQDFRPPKIINICWKRGLGPRALNLAFPKTPRVLSGALEDRIEAFFAHFPSGPGQQLAGQSFRTRGGVWALFLLSVV